MPHFMIVLILYINLLTFSWIKSYLFFDEYGVFNLEHICLFFFESNTYYSANCFYTTKFTRWQGLAGNRERGMMLWGWSRQVSNRKSSPVIPSTDRNTASVLVSFVLCVALWLPAAGHYSCLILFVVLLLCFVDPVLYCDHLAGEERPGCLLLLVNKFEIITWILFDLEGPTCKDALRHTLACLGWFPTRVQNCVCPSSTTKKT